MSKEIMMHPYSRRLISNQKEWINDTCYLCGYQSWMRKADDNKRQSTLCIIPFYKILGWQTNQCQEEDLCDEEVKGTVIGSFLCCGLSFIEVCIPQKTRFIRFKYVQVVVCQLCLNKAVSQRENMLIKEQKIIINP
jgi:hypothetical protein